MTLPPRLPPNLGITSTLSRLGLKGGALPTLGAESIVPVMIYGDASESIASELVEARGAVHVFRPFLAVTYGVFEIQSLAPGGIVIESLILVAAETFAPVVGIAPVFTISLGARVTTGAASLSQFANIGGERCVSLLFSENIGPGFPVPITNEQAQFPLVNFEQRVADAWQWVQFPSRIYVPPGQFAAFVGPFEEPVQMGLVWRELADIQGVG